MPRAAFATRAAALAACDADVACVGAKFVHTEGINPWRTFGAALREDVVGKLRVQGDAIDPWVPITGPNGV